MVIFLRAQSYPPPSLLSFLILLAFSVCSLTQRPSSFPQVWNQYPYSMRTKFTTASPTSQRPYLHTELPIWCSSPKCIRNISNVTFLTFAKQNSSFLVPQWLSASPHPHPASENKTIGSVLILHFPKLSLPNLPANSVEWTWKMRAKSDHLHHHHSRQDLLSSLTWYHHHSRPDHLHSHFNTPQTGLSACTFVPSPTNSIPLPRSREVNYNVNQISRKHTLDLGISPLKTPEWLSISPGTKI